MLVTRKAPDFTAPAITGGNEIVEKFRFYDNFGEKGAVLFFYPLDFTFVCPSELIAFNHRYEAFRERGINLVSVSVDSHFTHLAWKNTPVSKGGVGDLSYPMVADLTKSISRDYDVLLDDGVALRGAFLVDRDGTIRHAVINDLPLGRNADEMLRVVDAMLFTNEHGQVCPAGWTKGDPGMDASPGGVAEYLEKHGEEL